MTAGEQSLPLEKTTKNTMAAGDESFRPEKTKKNTMAFSSMSCSTTASSKVAREQKNYMRSCSVNPMVATQSCWDNPITVAGSAKSLARPINKRTYWTPAHWVEKVETGEAHQHSVYVDYAFSNEFNQIWKETIKKENAFQRSASRSRKRPAFDKSSTNVKLDLFETEYSKNYSRLKHLSTSSSSVSQDLPTLSLSQSVPVIQSTRPW
eukprot:TRINITY_DN6345_c0_g1_i1.p1 TRINITY_DN6345_c0_g1~~TRINITY_DN6345_c0_g1_i1.p1  ORF type:complete len:208 (-),score=29.67 TRINITY_DN6345_c0_g1_i1:264-887(-)